MRCHAVAMRLPCSCHAQLPDAEVVRGARVFVASEVAKQAGISRFYLFHRYAATGQGGADFHQSHGAHVSSQSGGLRECEHDASQSVSQPVSQS